MKNLLKIALSFLLCFPVMAMAQNKELSDFFDKYQKQDHVTSIAISLDALQIHLADDMEDGTVNDLMNQVDKFRLLRFENQYRTFRNTEFKDEIGKIIDKADYKLLMDVISDDEIVKIYILKGDENLIKEGLIVAQEDEEAALIWVSGNIDPSDFMHSHRHFRKFH